MEKDIVISIPKDDSGFAELIEGDPTLRAINLSGAGMDGGSEYLVFLIPLAHFTVKTLVDLIKAHWEKAKNVKLEINGMTVTGASLDEISEFLKRHSPERHGEQ